MKITSISDELESNIKRRMELEKQLEDVKSAENSQKQRDIFLGYGPDRFREDRETVSFGRMSKQAERVQELVVGERTKDS